MHGVVDYEYERFSEIVVKLCMSGSDLHRSSEAAGVLPNGVPPPPQFFSKGTPEIGGFKPPPPPLMIATTASHVHHPQPPQPQALPLAVVIKSEPPTSEDDFLRSPQEPPQHHHNNIHGVRKRYLDESSHDEIVKSEFGQAARVVAPTGRTILGKGFKMRSPNENLDMQKSCR